MEEKENEDKRLKKVSIFDKMMKDRHLQDSMNSLGSSPTLKRTAEQLSSPSSPQDTNIPKKNKESVLVNKPSSP